ALCNGKLSPCVTEDVSLKLLAELVVRGGWPESLGLALNDAISIPKEYIKAVIENDIDRIDDKKRNKHKFELLLRSLARNEATVASNNTLKNDIKAEDAEDIDIDTVAEYLDVLSRLFLIENQPPFAANVRSRTRIKQKEKRHFCDPSLACALMKLTPDMLINDLNTFGFQFEAMVERDLRIYADAFDATVYHYQDYKNKEIDAVIELPTGEWCAFEIKLGANQIDVAAENLLAIQADIAAEENGKPPKVLCVICGMSNAAYQRPDGVFVIPITALKN
ncbi:MAG: DUF4143 domain-containing protein, partial [Clostridia bacterium]|nr:DUF4143 domain-containing protein [Clostridia bacterium]